MQPDHVLKLLGEDHSFKSCCVKIEACKTPVTLSSEVESLLADLKAKAGWVARQSGVVFLPAADDKGLGAVLEAEVVADNVTLQIRKLGGAWVWTRLTETAEAGRLSQDVVLATVGGGTAYYRRYWELRDDGAAEVIACRLVGVKGQK